MKAQLLSTAEMPYSLTTPHFEEVRGGDFTFSFSYLKILDLVEAALIQYIIDPNRCQHDEEEQGWYWCMFNKVWMTPLNMRLIENKLHLSRSQQRRLIKSLLNKGYIEAYHDYTRVSFSRDWISVDIAKLISDLTKKGV